MIIYRDSTSKFCEDVLHNRVADIMRNNFSTFFGFCPNIGEYNAWNNSCQHLKNIIDLAALKDNFICLEYEVPYNTGRIDCLLFGKGVEEKSYVVLIELKQWTDVDEIEDEGNFVETFTGGHRRKVAHPSQQVEGYHNHLTHFVQVFEVDDKLDLYSCAYCHNYTKKDGVGLFAGRYKALIDKFPVYTKSDVEKLADRLRKLLAKGEGFEIFNRFMQSPIQPSKKLLDNVSKIVKEHKAEFSLLNEQLVAKNVIMAKTRKAVRTKQKSVIVVHGGPGTGKTVIALNVLAELAQQGKSIFYACKSKPFREALQNRVGRGARMLFTNLSSFIPSRVNEDHFDVVLVDEAHRMEKNSNTRFTRAEARTTMPQVEQLIRCAKTVVFFC